MRIKPRVYWDVCRCLRLMLKNSNPYFCMPSTAAKIGWLLAGQRSHASFSSSRVCSAVRCYRTSLSPSQSTRGRTREKGENWSKGSSANKGMPGQWWKHMITTWVKMLGLLEQFSPCIIPGARCFSLSNLNFQPLWEAHYTGNSRACGMREWIGARYEETQCSWKISLHSHK